MSPRRFLLACGGERETRDIGRALLHFPLDRFVREGYEVVTRCHRDGAGREGVMTMRVARIWVLALVAALVAGLLSVVVTEAPAQAMGVSWTLAQTRRYVTGKSVGPNRYTYGGKATITGLVYRRTLANGTRVYRPVVRITNPNPVAPVSAMETRLDGRRPGPLLVRADSWLNPFSWDWGGIMGRFWSRIMHPCLTGAAAGLGTTVSGTLIVNVLARAGRVFVGPYGYAAIAVGACVWSIIGGGS